VRRTARLASVAAALALGTCGGGSSTPSTPTTPENPNQIVISAAGVVTPSQLTITAGSRVLFINSHNRSHQIASDPHPEHTDCPEINTVGLLASGERRETANLITVRTCGFHDHDDPDNPSLKGRIVIH
jgi:plastocyanin